TAVVRTLRRIMTFGSQVLKDRACRELRVTLHDMRLPHAERPAPERLTKAHANAIRAAAHEQGFPSMALAQALQFECSLRQKEVIGEWVPIDEDGTSAVIHNRLKWVRGLRRNAIDQNFILRHDSELSRKSIEIDLRKDAPMVMEELAHLSGQRSGSDPMI